MRHHESEATPEQPTGQPTLSDGAIALRPWRDGDAGTALVGHDESLASWFGYPRAVPTGAQQRAAIDRWHRSFRDGRRAANFVIESAGEVAGCCEVRRASESATAGELTWALLLGHRGQGIATRAVRALGDWALAPVHEGGLGLARIEARVEPGNAASLRVAIRSGLRREGVQRVVPGTGVRPETEEYVVFGRLSTDPPLSEPGSFRSLLNSFLPRKRVIAQSLIRDFDDRVLICQLTYKTDWDLPGGVVEEGESPDLAAGREVTEELGLRIPVGDLLLVDWLPPWGGWDDAVCFVFDGARHPAEVLAGAVYQHREIRSAEFCAPAQIAERTQDFTARRVAAALDQLLDPATSRLPGFTHSGRATTRDADPSFSRGRPVP
ncbi:MAG: NUDIX hydrolase [Nocardioides sp.]